MYNSLEVLSSNSSGSGNTISSEKFFHYACAVNWNRQCKQKKEVLYSARFCQTTDSIATCVNWIVHDSVRFVEVLGPQQL